MSFCHNCGQKLEKRELFCSNCGTRLYEEESYVKGDESTHIYGYIFTNLMALSLKLKVEIPKLQELFRSFIAAKKNEDVYYECIDVSELGLIPQDGWQKHHTALSNRYQHALKLEKKKVTYTFIIGGDDIIPMPVVKHFRSNFTEKDIETDILYSFLSEKDTQQKLENWKLFQYPQSLHIGRLPLAEDATFQHLESYVLRCIHWSQTQDTTITKAYAQCDPHWKKVSLRVMDNLIVNECIPSYDPPITPQFYYQHIFLTPDITMDLINKVFNTQAQIYYFNMHGSNAPAISGFIGVSTTEGEGSFIGISPNELASAEKPNIVVTEACYGAKFIRKKVKDSMLLSAISHNTMIYLGSSRIAYGMVDTDSLTSSASVSNADVIAQGFISQLLSGTTAGEALFKARYQIFSTNKSITAENMLTVTEFNLFGDPTLRTYPNKRDSKSGPPPITNPVLSAIGYEKCNVENLYKEDENNSILSTIKQLVNTNIQQIRKIVDKHLYDHYNIQPRKLTHIFLNTYPDGKKEYTYAYLQNEYTQLLVTTSIKGENIEVLTSK